MIKLTKEIYAWIKTPDDVELILGPGKKFRLVCLILLLQILIALPFAGMISFIHHYVIKLERPLYDWSLWENLLFVVVLLPFFEEFFFRFPLKYRRNYLARLLNFLSRGWLQKKWSSIFKYFLFLLASLFGLIHLSNFTNTGLFFFALFPIIVGSQLIGGLLFSYSRIKFGFLYSVFQHGAFNLALTALVFTSFHNQELINVSDEGFSINMTELQYLDEAGGSYAARYSSDIGKDLIHSVDGRNISLHGLIDSLGLEGPKPYDDTWINVSIHSQKGVTKKEIQDILKKEIKFDPE